MQLRPSTSGAPSRSATRLPPGSTRAYFGIGVCLLAFGATSVADAAEPASHGAVVVAVGVDAGTAAASLARVVYRDAALRPTLDEATARVLAGEPVPDGASPALRELADLRASVERAGSDAAARRLLAAIGSETHAAVVVPVSRDEGALHARALRVEGARFVGAALSAQVVAGADGSAQVRWPDDATSTLRHAVGPLAPAPIAAPARPAPDEHAPRSTFSSPWFWGGLGVVAAAAVTVFVLSRTTGHDAATVHVGGTVPQ